MRRGECIMMFVWGVFVAGRLVVLGDDGEGEERESCFTTGVLGCRLACDGRGLAKPLLFVKGFVVGGMNADAGRAGGVVDIVVGFDKDKARTFAFLRIVHSLQPYDLADLQDEIQTKWIS
jgi:hypothetical protein